MCVCDSASRLFLRSVRDSGHVLQVARCAGDSHVPVADSRDLDCLSHRDLTDPDHACDALRQECPTAGTGDFERFQVSFGNRCGVGRRFGRGLRPHLPQVQTWDGIAASAGTEMRIRSSEVPNDPPFHSTDEVLR